MKLENQRFVSLKDESEYDMRLSPRANKKYLLGIELSPKEFDFLLCEQSNGKELKVVDGKVVAVERVVTEREIAEMRISELKSLLDSTDYKAIKYAEGLLTEEEYAETKAQRQAWRDEINQLEKMIQGE